MLQHFLSPAPPPTKKSLQNTTHLSCFQQWPYFSVAMMAITVSIPQLTHFGKAFAPTPRVVSLDLMCLLEPTTSSSPDHFSQHFAPT